MHVSGGGGSGAMNGHRIYTSVYPAEGFSPMLQKGSDGSLKLSKSHNSVADELISIMDSLDKSWEGKDAEAARTHITGLRDASVAVAVKNMQPAAEGLSAESDGHSSLRNRLEPMEAQPEEASFFSFLPGVDSQEDKNAQWNAKNQRNIAAYQEFDAQSQQNKTPLRTEFPEIKLTGDDGGGGDDKVGPVGPGAGTPGVGGSGGTTPSGSGGSTGGSGGYGGAPAVNSPGDSGGSVGGSGSGSGSGAVRLPNGDVRMPDGSIRKPDGTVIKPDGTRVLPDGTVVKPDGTRVLPDGTIIRPNGQIVPPGNTGASGFSPSGSDPGGAGGSAGGAALAAGAAGGAAGFGPTGGGAVAGGGMGVGAGAGGLGAGKGMGIGAPTQGAGGMNPAAAAGKGGVGMGGRGMGGMMGGAGAGGAKGGDEQEHQDKYYVKQELDPGLHIEYDEHGEKLVDESTGWTVVPPVIGE